MAEKQFKNLELKVGLFILISFVIAIVIITLIAIQKNIFTKKIKVQVIADSGEGLVKGMSVVYSGFQIAKVDELYLRDDGKVVMKIKIPIRYAKWIKKDSTVKLSSKNFIGSSSIIFSGGKGEKITDNTIFVLKRDKGVEQLIKEVKPVLDDVKIIIYNLKEITTKMNQMTPYWLKLSEGLGDLGSDISAKRGSIGKLSRTNFLINKIDNLDKKISRILSKVENRVDDTKQTINYTNKLLLNSDKLVKNSNKLVLNLDDKISRSEQLISESGKLIKNLRLLSDNMSLYFDEMDFLLGNANILLLNLQKRWPFTPPNKEINDRQRLKLP